MIHTQTGNGVDIVSDYEDSKEVIKGLYIRETNQTIPLKDPEGFFETGMDLCLKIVLRDKKSPITKSIDKLFGKQHSAKEIIKSISKSQKRRKI
jgi:hypothetical protein